MKHRSKNMNKALILAVVTLLSSIGVYESAIAATSTKNPPKRKAVYSHNNSSLELWARIRNNFNISEMHHVKIQKYIKEYANAEKSLNKISTQAKPYLFYIVEQLEKRGMPGELALLPMLESKFKPQATSHKGAAGLWQFIPSTGRNYGLKQDAWYDGRRDISASTNAALDYLQFLHKKFDHNWMLALAAYNAGEGAVNKAIKRNKRAGKSTSFWDLKLPKETQKYVPKFLALAEVIGHPEKHDISLPSIENKPYFTSVDPGSKINLNEASKLAGIQIAELKRLNPCYRGASTHPKGPQALLLPVENAETFENNLANRH